MIEYKTIRNIYYMFLKALSKKSRKDIIYQIHLLHPLQTSNSLCPI